MKSWATFSQKVYKKDASGHVIAAGDAIDLVLKDKSVLTVTVTDVSNQGKTIGYTMNAEGLPRPTDIQGVDGNHQFVNPAATSKHDEDIVVTTHDTPTMPRFDGLVPPVSHD